MEIRLNDVLEICLWSWNQNAKYLGGRNPPVGPAKSMEQSSLRRVSHLPCIYKPSFLARNALLGAPRCSVSASIPQPTDLLPSISFLLLILNSSSRSGRGLTSSRKPSVTMLSHVSSPSSRHLPSFHSLLFFSANSGPLPTCRT